MEYSLPFSFISGGSPHLIPLGTKSISRTGLCCLNGSSLGLSDSKSVQVPSKNGSPNYKGSNSRVQTHCTGHKVYEYKVYGIVLWVGPEWFVVYSL